MNQIAQSFALDDLRDLATLAAISRILNQKPYSLNDFVWSVFKGSWIFDCDIKLYELRRNLQFRRFLKGPL